MKEAFKKNPYDPGVGRNKRDDDSVRKGTNKQIHNRGLREDGPNQSSLEQTELISNPSNRYEDCNQGQEKLEKRKIQRTERQREKEKKKSEALQEKNHRPAAAGHWLVRKC